MTSNAVDEQRTRGWKELKSMPQGARYGHGCCEIDDHRMIILGGRDDDGALSSGFIYDARSEQSTPLPNDIPAARYDFSAVANELYMFIIGGRDDNGRTVNTVYRLSFETYEWATLAPMGTARAECAGVLLGNYLYMFGGSNDSAIMISSVERYSIVGSTWEDLPDMANAHCYHCAVAAMGNIYILGVNRTRVLEVFDASLLEWRDEASLCDISVMRIGAAAVVLKNRYLVIIGGQDQRGGLTAGCLIYDCSINRWSSTPASMDMITARDSHTAAVLDGKIVVAGGFSRCGRGRFLSSMECIDARDLLEYAHV